MRMLLKFLFAISMAPISSEVVVNAYKDNKYTLDKRPGAVNLFGVRSGIVEAGKFDDFIGCLSWVDDSWSLKVWPATTDSGLKYLETPLTKYGTAGLVPGQYKDVWKIDSHNGWVTTLCQRNGSVSVYRDNNRDRILNYDPKTIMKGSRFGINIHPRGNNSASNVNFSSSAGCQVFRFYKDWEDFMELNRGHVDDTFTYTLFNDSDLNRHPSSAPTSEPLKDSSSTCRLTWAQWIINKEARRDSLGQIKVHQTSQNDFEVAGINNKWHPKEAGTLKKLIEQKQFKQAELQAKVYIRDYTSAVEGWHPDERVVFFLRDCCFNRGPTGAGMIYQIALRSAGFDVGEVDGEVALTEKRSGSKLQAEDLVFRLLLARQTYERRKRSEQSQFWVGLSNRWVDCAQLALSVGDPHKFSY